MDGGQLEKGVKFGKFCVHIVIPLFNRVSEVIQTL